MKTIIMNYRNIHLTGILILFSVCILHAQSFTESKKIERIFPATTSTTVEIINKYGKVHILSWDKDSVGFDIELTVKSDNLSKVKKIMENIDFDFTSTDYYVIAETEFGKRYNSLFESIKNLAESLIPSDNVVEIDYTVQVPETIELKINNRYGDVYIDNHAGNLRLNLSNGDLKVNEITGTADIQIEIGDGVINHIQEGKLDIAYSDFEIKDAGKLNIFCRSSRVNIGVINDLSLDSRRDKLFIDEINMISGETYFSDVYVYDILQELNLTMKYGSLNMENIRQEFSFLNINSNYTDINLTFDSGSSYLVDINHTNAEFTYPERLAVVEEKVLDKDAKDLNTYGKIGSSDSSSKVKVTAVKGTITIIHK
jgi:hypothetical protein